MFGQISFRMTSATFLEEIKEVPLTCRNCQLQKIKCSRTYPCTRCDRLKLECFVETHAPRPLELASTINFLKQSIESIGVRLERFEDVTKSSYSMEYDLTPSNEGVPQRRDDGSATKMRKVKISKMISSIDEAVKRLELRLKMLEKRVDGGGIDKNDRDPGFLTHNNVKKRTKKDETQKPIKLDGQEMVALRMVNKDPKVEILWGLILTEMGLRFDSRITTFHELNETIHQFHHRHSRCTRHHSVPRFYSHDYSRSSSKEPISKTPFFTPQSYVPSYSQAAYQIPFTSFPIILTKGLTDTLINAFMTYRCCSFIHINVIEPISFCSRYHSYDSLIKNPFEALVSSICSFTARHGMKAHTPFDHSLRHIDISYAYSRRARLILEEYFDQPSLDAIQAILYIAHFSPGTNLPFEQLSSDSTLLWLAVRMLLEIRIYRDDVAVKSFPKRELRELKLVQIAIGTQIPWCEMLYTNRLSDGLHILFDLVDTAGLKSWQYSRKEENDYDGFNELCTFGLQISRFTLDIFDNINSPDLRTRTVEIQSRISAWHQSLPNNWSFSALVHI